MQSGRQKAYGYLRDTVLTDPAMQGEFLSEQMIADAIGVSRTPIREALLMLAAEELVSLVPKRGAYIAPLSGREIGELMEMRGVLEKYAAERTVATGTVPVREMDDILTRQNGLRGQENAKEFIDADHHFHATLVSAVGNDLMTKQYDALRSRQIRAGVVALYQSGGRQDEVLVEHRRILHGLAAGQAAVACVAIDEHIAATRRILIDG
ncbi:GntR family transcriptional regulator [Streptomyces oceani]|uniref:GntR family transcriptional regulator n=1 Tax=Streptomyces oceani TaxID=1075402 RepID=A0A1E7JF58_9ACTN|nr:GntR family transcriptional regulator [Streptomyces oceani]OEU85100.1 GntR family transcriptional regulator [Streptomyces oceani]